MKRRTFLACVAASLCALSNAHAQPALETVASMSIIGDFVKQVGGERVNVSLLVTPGSDAHVFQPSPADVRRVSQAKLVFVNGLGLEGWLSRLAQASGGKSRIVTVSKGVKPIRNAADAHGHGHGHDHGGDVDPHAWQDVANAKIYVANIRDALALADPDGKDFYANNAARYVLELDQLDRDLREAVAGIPQAQRRVITSHEAFGYFARAYGMKFIAPQGMSTESQASSRDVARIIRQIKAERIPAIFLEKISDERLIRQIARESGAAVGEPVFSDTLSEAEGPAPTYVAMMRHNMRAFTQALR